MIALLENNVVPIAIAVLIAVAIAFWIFRGGTPAKRDEHRPAVSPPARRADGAEGDSVPDEISAATCDVAGQFLGVDAHPNIPPAGGPPDTLQTMKGVGPKLAAQLNACGITRFEQLAGLGPTEIALVDARMGPFKGRIQRDRLIEQAAFLARGDTDGFEATFGRLGGA